MSAMQNTCIPWLRQTCKISMTQFKVQRMDLATLHHVAAEAITVLET